MTVDDHTAAQAARAITLGVADLHEMIAMGQTDAVFEELEPLTDALIHLGNLLMMLNLGKVK